MTEELVPYLPAPTVQRAEDGTFSLERGGDRSIGRMHGFHGNVGILVRAYSYVFLHGSDGLKAVSELAALNANYLAHLVKDDFPLAHPDMRPMHEFVATAKPLREATGARAMDVAKRVIDLGFHPSTVYFPLVVEEAMMVEPTETESQERRWNPTPSAPAGGPGGPRAPGDPPRGARDDPGPPPRRGEGRTSSQAALVARSGYLHTGTRTSHL